MGTTPYANPTSASGANWNNPTNVYTSNNSYSDCNTLNAQLVCGGFSFIWSVMSADVKRKVIGVEVSIEARSDGVLGLCPTRGSNHKLGVECSFDGGSTWESPQDTSIYYCPSEYYRTFGGLTYMWSRIILFEDDLSSTNFKVRVELLEKNKSANKIYVDHVRARCADAFYRHVSLGTRYAYYDDIRVI